VSERPYIRLLVLNRRETPGEQWEEVSEGASDRVVVRVERGQKGTRVR